MKPPILFSKERSDRHDRRTFTSPHHFQSFLGLQLQPNDFKCLAQTADKTFGTCTHALGNCKTSTISKEVKNFIKFGFPSPEAEDSLWRIVVSCICSVNRHHIMVATTSMTPVRVTQYQWLYDRWHGELWAAYQEGYDPLAAFSPVDGDRDRVVLPTTPPSLGSSVEVWKAAATTKAPAERKPPLTRAFTDTFGARKRFREVLGCFPWRGAMLKRLGGKIDDKTAGKRRDRANTGLSSAMSDTSNWNPGMVAESFLTPRDDLLIGNVSIPEPADPSETPPRIKPEDKDEGAVTNTDARPTDGDMFTVDTPTRPPIKRNNAHARSASSPPSRSHLVPSPDSIASKVSSIFSNKDGLDAVDTPSSPGAYSMLSEQPSCAACGQSQKSQRPLEITVSSHHSVVTKDETSPIQARVGRRPVSMRNFSSRVQRDLVNDISESEEEVGYEEEEKDEEEKDEEDDDDEYDDEKYDDEDRAHISLYCRNPHQTNEPCSFAKKTMLKYPHIDIPVRCIPPSSTQYIRQEESQPPTFLPWIPSRDPKTVLRNMLHKLHTPILDTTKAKPGWLYGFTLADPERRKYIKIGWTERMPGRISETASKCKYEPVLLFKAFLPCAPAVIERMIHMHLYKHQRRMMCAAPSCGAPKKGHREWFEIELDKALDIVLKWVAFSDCMPYDVQDQTCLDRYWQEKTSHAWNSLWARRDPELWFEKYWWPAVEGHDRFRAPEKS